MSGEEKKEIRIWKLADNFHKKKIEVESIVNVEGVSSNKTAVQCQWGIETLNALIFEESDRGHTITAKKND